MGLFDRVDFEMICPMCGEKVKGFQTKDSSNIMMKVSTDIIHNWYSGCRKCGLWINLTKEQLHTSRNKTDDEYES